MSKEGWGLDECLEDARAWHRTETDGHVMVLGDNRENLKCPVCKIVFAPIRRGDRWVPRWWPRRARHEPKKPARRRVECNVCGEPLEYAAGVAYCPYC